MLVLGVLVNCSVFRFGNEMVWVMLLVFWVILVILCSILLVCVIEEFFGSFILVIRYSLFWVGMKFGGISLKMKLVFISSIVYIMNIVL